MISTTIKKIYMDKILSGEKTIEYKEITPYWRKRLGDKEHRVINFLCGRKSYKFKVEWIHIALTPPKHKDIIDGTYCWHIHLGERIGD